MYALKDPVGDTQTPKRLHISAKKLTRDAVADRADVLDFRRSVLSCINADFCDQILILQHFSRSTRCAHFAPLETQKICKISSKFCEILLKFSEFCKILLNFVKFRQNFSKIWRNSAKISSFERCESVKIL